METHDVPGVDGKSEKAPRKQAKTAVVTPKIETLIYVGPNIAGGTLTQYATFRGGLSPHVERLVLDQPELGKLIIPVTQLNAFRDRVGVPGTIEHRAYQKAKGGI